MPLVDAEWLPRGLRDGDLVLVVLFLGVVFFLAAFFLGVVFFLTAFFLGVVCFRVDCLVPREDRLVAFFFWMDFLLVPLAGPVCRLVVDP